MFSDHPVLITLNFIRTPWGQFMLILPSRSLCVIFVPVGPHLDIHRFINLNLRKKRSHYNVSIAYFIFCFIFFVLNNFPYQVIEEFSSIVIAYPFHICNVDCTFFLSLPIWGHLDVTFYCQYCRNM